MQVHGSFAGGTAHLPQLFVPSLCRPKSRSTPFCRFPQSTTSYQEWEQLNRNRRTNSRGSASVYDADDLLPLLPNFYGKMRPV